MNSVNLIGRLTREPELKTGDTARCMFSIAVDDPYASKERADFFRIVCFGKQAENAARYLVKGQQVAVTGRLKSDSYETGEGERKYTVDIIASGVLYLEKPKKKDGSENQEEE